MAQQYGLGRGLASLIPPKKTDENTVASSPLPNNHIITPHENGYHPAEMMSVSAPTQTVPTTVLGTGVQEVALEKIVPNPHQPRLSFDEVKLQELADSIKEHGILQPLVVSPSTKEGEYEIIAGERRFRAAKKAGLTTVPVIVRDVDEQEKLELAIIENIQRHDLNPIEEAKSFLRLADEFNLSQEAVAKKMGKSRSTVANTLRLLQLPIEIQRAVSEGRITEGHAKALLAIENPEKQRAVFELIIKEELTVRETETRVQSISVKPYVRSAVSLNPELLERTEHLTQVLGTKVKITPSGKGGKVIIEYYAPEDLDGLLRRLEE
ncbi:MAG: ParB/RepB/Spo0J family partition protein [Candidatus Moranbacteria bacterium]|nr:ParB/RepB/Spo0J family partition protein [Candidatus Moranbacteria bacterium]MDD3964430.1 ParB/RepB/Spo0J family partition protein [Candidatus Moranbacteria bacterium]